MALMAVLDEGFLAFEDRHDRTADGTVIAGAATRRPLRGEDAAESLARTLADDGGDAQPEGVQQMTVGRNNLSFLVEDEGIVGYGVDQRREGGVEEDLFAHFLDFRAGCPFGSGEESRGNVFRCSLGHRPGLRFC